MQINQVPGEAEPETVDSLELGLRDTIGSLRYEISAFYLQKEHFFFRDSDGWNVIDGKTRHRGVEAQFTLPLLDQRLKLSGSATYAIHSYDFDQAPSDISSGDDIDTAPRLQGNLRFAWTPSEAFRTELEWIHMDKYYTNSANTAEYEGHDLINLRASYQLTENLTLYGRIENLSDTAYAERADYGFGSHRYFPGETRSYFLGLRANF